MIIVYYLLFVSGLLLFLHYLYFKAGKTMSKRFNHLVLLLPAMICIYSGIISLPSKEHVAVTIDQNLIGMKLVDYTAISIRHYINEASDNIPIQDSNEVVDNFTETMPSIIDDKYTMLYKDGEFILEKEIHPQTYYYYRSLWKSKSDEYIKDSITGWYFFEIDWDGNSYNSLNYTKSKEIIQENKPEVLSYSAVIKYEPQILYKIFSRNKLNTITKSSIVVPKQSLVYGIDYPDSIGRKLNHLASIWEFRPSLLVWRGEPEDIYEYQKTFWGDGQDNEVIFCIGLKDDLSTEIMWSNSFSSVNSNDLSEFILNSSLAVGSEFNINQYVEELNLASELGVWEEPEETPLRLVEFRLFTSRLIALLTALIITILNLILFVRVIKK